MKRALLVTLGVVVMLGGVTAIALPTILHKAGLHPEYEGVSVRLSPGKRGFIGAGGNGRAAYWCDGFGVYPCLLQFC